MKVTVEVPEVPFPGPDDSQHFFRRAAEVLRSDRYTGEDIRNVSGSNVRETIAALLVRVSDAMDEVTAARAERAAAPQPPAGEDWCPTCGVPPEEACMTKGGRTTEDHAARRRKRAISA